MMFIPAAVGLITSWDIISGSLVKYVVVTFVSTLVVMGVSGLVTQGVIRRGKSK